MSRSAVIAHDAIILKSIDYRDSDKIVTLLTREAGRLSAIARSAKKSKKRFRTLEPFCELRVELSGKSELKTLRGTELKRAHPHILISLDRMRCAGNACALVRHLSVEGSAHVELYDLLADFFKRLNSPPDSQKALTLGFSFRALSLTGFSPSLDRCVRSGAPREGRAAYFDSELGGVVQRSHARRGSVALKSETLRLMSDALGGSWWQEAPWDDAIFEEAQAAFDAFVRWHVVKQRQER